MNLRIGVIGTGVMGTNHSRVLTGLKDRCQFIGVYDADIGRASTVANHFQTKAFPTLDELLSSIDAAVIAAPTLFHYDISRQCLERGIHVLIEKPITATIEEGEKLKKLAKDKNLKIQVGHIELFNPTIKILNKIMQQEEIIAIDIHRLSPFSDRWKDVDVISDMMIHDLYIFSYLTVSPPVSCTAYGRAIHQHVNHVVATFQCKDGMIATLTGSQITEEKVRTIQVVAKEAYIHADLMDRKIFISRSTSFFLSHHEMDYKQQNIVEKVIVPSYEPLREELVDFIDSILADREPFITAEQGIDALRMVELVKSRMIHYS